MSDLRSNLRKDFHDKGFRHEYAEESLNTHIATQIKVLREQQNLTQRELAMLSEMAQSRIAVLEDVNYSSWSINTLRRLARAFDLRLSVGFETFSSLIVELENFSRSALEKTSFVEDAFFHAAYAPEKMNTGGTFVQPDNSQGCDVFQEHLQQAATRKKAQGKIGSDSQIRRGSGNAAISCAIG